MARRAAGSGRTSVDLKVVGLREAIADEDIRKRAYEIYVERGMGHGRDVEDWLQAERELGGRPRVKRRAAAG